MANKHTSSLRKHVLFYYLFPSQRQLLLGSRSLALEAQMYLQAIHAQLQTKIINQ